jgi:hypothetical protein
MPPPFSTPGPSRLQHPQFHPQANQWESFDYPTHGEYQYQPNEDIEREGLEGSWKSSRRPGSNGMMNDPHGIDMEGDFDRPPISDQWEPGTNHPALPSPYHDPRSHLIIPEHHHQDPMNPYRHQQQLHYPTDKDLFPPQVYQTPQIQHQAQYHRSQTPLPTSKHYPDPIREISGDLEEVGVGEDKEEEIMEFGASTDEWKLLWSNRKGLR